MLAEGGYPFERLVTHRFILPEIPEATLTFERRVACLRPVIAFD